MLYQRKRKKLLLLPQNTIPIGLVDKIYIQEEKLYYEIDTDFILFTNGLIVTPSASHETLLDFISNSFISGCDSSTDDLLSHLMLSRMKHSEINDDICIVHSHLK